MDKFIFQVKPIRPSHHYHRFAAAIYKILPSDVLQMLPDIHQEKLHELRVDTLMSSDLNEMVTDNISEMFADYVLAIQMKEKKPKGKKKGKK